MFSFFLVSSYSAARLCSLFNLKDTSASSLFVMSFRIPFPSIPFMRGIIYFILLLLHVKQGLNWSQVLVSNTVFMVGHFPTETSYSGDVLFCTACYLLPNNSLKNLPLQRKTFSGFNGRMKAKRATAWTCPVNYKTVPRTSSMSPSQSKGIECHFSPVEPVMRSVVSPHLESTLLGLSCLSLWGCTVGCTK